MKLLIERARGCVLAASVGVKVVLSAEAKH
jgi:hypothetical protein